MAKAKVLYEENSILIAKYHHPKSDDYLDYRIQIFIKDSGKTPIQANLKFEGIPPAYAPMPPEEHSIKAKNILELSLKIQRWLDKYGYKLV